MRSGSGERYEASGSDLPFFEWLNENEPLPMFRRFDPADTEHREAASRGAVFVSLNTRLNTEPVARPPADREAACKAMGGAGLEPATSCL